MGSRALPTECEHGWIVDLGDFGDDDLPFGGAEPCPECETGASETGGAVVIEYQLESSKRSLPAYPVIVVHLDDGTGLAACCGVPFDTPDPNLWPQTARWPCAGCMASVTR